ncbi:hypothetical protein Anas_09538 [Armadillidium nasatum]|uniref:Uncharacterized protein n=1 Tax=Armadillidium nasatum TaxID=96803 RepID=A0A5N5SJV5_9CRUS|nr:hypothetical protein Anas_09538 [Armadillidium nasatum]
MKTIKKEKVEKDDTINLKNKQQKMEIVHQEHIIVNDSLQTREEIVVTKNVETNEKSECFHLEDIKGKSRWQKYKKRYSEKWENDPKLKEWIQQDSENPNKALCRFCNKLLRAHKFDLYKHSGTRKHRRNCKRGRSEMEKSGTDIDVDHDDDDDEVAKEIVLSISEKPSPNKRLKKEKISEPFIVVETHDNVAGYSADHNEDENIFMAYSEDESFLSSKTPSDHLLTEIAHRVGIVLIKEVSRVLRTDKNILQFFKDNDQILLTDSNINKLTKICVGHMSQKFLVESAMESLTSKSSLNYGDKDFSNKLKSIEEKLETTVSELKALKTNFSATSSQTIPLSSFDLSKIFQHSSCEQ